MYMYVLHEQRSIISLLAQRSSRLSPLTLHFWELINDAILQRPDFRLAPAPAPAPAQPLSLPVDVTYHTCTLKKN
jgi:hypothetical protein